MKNASATGPAPRIAAISTVRANPSRRLASDSMGLRRRRPGGIAFRGRGGLRCGLVFEFGDGTPDVGGLRLAGSGNARPGRVAVARDARRRLKRKPVGGPAHAGS